MGRRGPSRDSPPEGAGMECRRKGLTMENEKKLPTLSKQALRRLPEYLSLLSELQAQGVQSVSSPVLARQLHYGEGYVYAHDTKNKIARMTCLPESLKDRRYYLPTEEGTEKIWKERLEQSRAFRLGGESV